MEGGVATVLAPADATSGVEILLDEVSTLLEMVDAFDAIAPLELLPDDLGFLDFDPLLPHQVLPHLQHRHRVLVRVRWIEVIWGWFIELQSLLSPHFSLSQTLLSLSKTLSLSLSLPQSAPENAMCYVNAVCEFGQWLVGLLGFSFFFLFFFFMRVNWAFALIVCRL